MPSHHTPPSGVSATLVKIVFLRQRGHRVWIRLHGRSRRDAEESSFRIDRAQRPVLIRLDPGDIVADRPDLPAVESLRRHQHRRNSSCRRRSGNAAAT